MYVWLLAKMLAGVKLQPHANHASKCVYNNIYLLAQLPIGQKSRPSRAGSAQANIRVLASHVVVWSSGAFPSSSLLLAELVTLRL